jgi:DNA-binding protein HU-beta
MNQAELVAKTAANIDMQKSTVERCLHGLVDTIESSLEIGEKVTIRRFGSLRISQHKQRNGIDPSTLEPLVTPASNRVKFDASPNLLDKIQGA